MRFTMTDVLSGALARIAKNEGRVISVIWAPAPSGGRPLDQIAWASGFIVVSEFEDNA